MTQPSPTARAAMLPRHDPIGIPRQVFEAACLLTAGGLLAWLIVRLALAPWAMPAAVLCAAFLGAVAADFVSGMVHWAADTWGTETMPLLGRRFVRPFRVHHVNPDDFLRRRFLDTNGDVAMLTIPALLAAMRLPLDAAWGQVAAGFTAAFCLVGLPTNQVHQWAHMPRRPRWVRFLQDRGVILSRRDHGRHHRTPYARNYCIATGWCNPLLERIDFFRRLERLVTRITGLVPRDDDAAFQQAVDREFHTETPSR